MVCPFCGRIKTSVQNTRQSNRRGQVWRRRHCEECGRLFTTRESIELGFMEVLKRSGSREKYSHAKLLRSLLFANDHLPDADAAFALADTIEKNLLAKLTDQVNHVSAADIAQTVLGVLKRFDTRAYVKYLSYQTDTLDAKDLRQYLKGSRV